MSVIDEIKEEQDQSYDQTETLRSKIKENDKQIKRLQQ